MKKKLIQIIFLVLLFVGCYFFNRNYILVDYQPEKLRVSMEIITIEEDIFQLFYKESEGKFKEANSQTIKVGGRAQPQKIHFMIPDSLAFTQFRFDFGNKFHISPVEINEIQLSFNGNSKIINREDIETYWKPNNYTKSSDLGYIRKVIGSRSDPFFSSKDFYEIIEELKSIPNHSRIAINVILSCLIALSLTLALNVLHFDQKPSNIYSLGFISVFLIMLIIPHLDEIWKLDNTNISEKRVLVKKPKFIYEKIKEYPEKFETYYNDNFGFRKKMVSLGSSMKVKFFKTSSNNDLVIVGKEGWLFYWEGDIKSSYLNKNSFDNESLGTLGNMLLSMNQWALDQDKIFLTTIYPNKHSIYEDKLPNRIKKLKEPGRKRMDHAYSFFYNNNIPTINHERILSSKKSERRLYLKNDSHWNSLGAFYAYHNIIEELSSIHTLISKPMEISDFTLTVNEDYRKGDLLNLLGIDNTAGIFKDTYLNFKPSAYLTCQLNENVYGKRSLVFENPHSTNALTALFFGDSYSNELLHFLPFHFNKTIFVRNIKLDKNLIEKINPDIIVYGIVERNLENF